MNILKKLTFIFILLTLILSAALIAHAGEVEFEYKFILTDQSGMTVENPRTLNAGDTLFVQIELTRKDITDPSYLSYGVEFRLFARGLTYNHDGVAFREGTDVKELSYLTGRSVGFAWYDMNQVGETVNNPMLAATWSYTVEDPTKINITVPVAIIFETESQKDYEPVGNARLFLDPNGGEIVGDDVTGEYHSGTVVVLPDAKYLDYTFLGWSDGESVYKPGAGYRVTGIVTLTAQYEGLVRDRKVNFNFNGGIVTDTDPSASYAVGEVIVIPGAEREGYRLICWTDGENEYQPGDEYEITKSTSFIAQWEPIETEPTPETEPGGKTPGGNTPGKDKTSDRTGVIAGLAAIGVVLLGAGIWWFIILWKRRWVLYSLKTGDIALYFKDDDHDAQVRVVALDDDDRHVILGTSGRVERGKRLRFIHGVGEIAEIEKGKYKGRLLVADGDYRDIIKVRVKVLDREIRERKND